MHSLIAQCAYYTRASGQCSNAFIELESLTSLSGDARDAYAELALAIFSKSTPEDPPAVAKMMRDCEAGAPACVATGMRIGSGERRVLACKRCGRKMLEDAARGLRACPLCHAKL